MPDLIKTIAESAARHPDRIAMSSGSETMTYRQLLDMMLNVAGNAQKFGMKPGERFLFAIQPDPKSMATALGLMYAGLTLAFVDPLTSNELFASRIEAVKPTYTLASPILYAVGKSLPSRVIKKARGVNIVDFSTGAKTNLSLGKSVPFANHISLNSWLDALAVPSEYDLDPERPIVIVFTSGTTGDPKGVVHTAASLGANVEAFADKFDITPGKLIFSEPMTIGITALARGAQWHIPQKGESMPDCDVYFGVPTDLLGYLKDIEQLPRDQRPNVRTVGSGAAPVLPSLLNRIYDVLGDETLVYGVYGMTEMLPIAVVEGREKLAYTGAGDLVGSFVGNTTASLAADNEVIISGDGLMRGYLNKELINSLPTGDAGQILEDGRLVLTGRKKDMFIRGHMNIYPGLYEPQLSRIEGVEQAVLVGLEDEYGDDYIALAVTVKATYDKETVANRVRREMKFITDGDAVPDTVVILEEIPTSGRALKIDRAELKRIVAQKVKVDGK